MREVDKVHAVLPLLTLSGRFERPGEAGGPVRAGDQVRADRSNTFNARASGSHRHRFGFLGHRLTGMEHAVQVSAHQVIPIGLLVVFQRAPALHAGVVDQYVDRSPGLDRSHTHSHRLARGDVKHLDLDRKTLVTQRLCTTVQFIGTATIQNDGGSGLRQAPSQSQADAGTGAGDQGTTPAKVKRPVV